MDVKILNEKSYLSLLKGMATGKPAKAKNVEYVAEADEPQVKIPVEHPGVLEVPEGKNVEDLPYSHFAALAKKKGFGEISKALTNLHTWNKDKHPALASWADKMQQRLHNEFSEEAKEE
jgi:hypothetical protein